MLNYSFIATDQNGMEWTKIYTKNELKEIIIKDGLDIVTKHSRWLLKGDKAIWTALTILNRAKRTPKIIEKSDRFMSITFLNCDEKSLFLV